MCAKVGPSHEFFSMFKMHPPKKLNLPKSATREGKGFGYIPQGLCQVSRNDKK